MVLPQRLLIVYRNVFFLVLFVPHNVVQGLHDLTRLYPSWPLNLMAARIAAINYCPCQITTLQFASVSSGQRRNVSQ
jgi:hypothetical protein